MSTNYILSYRHHAQMQSGGFVAWTNTQSQLIDYLLRVISHLAFFYMTKMEAKKGANKREAIAALKLAAVPLSALERQRYFTDLAEGSVEVEPSFGIAAHWPSLTVS